MKLSILQVFYGKKIKLQLKIENSFEKFKFYNDHASWVVYMVKIEHHRFFVFVKGLFM